ncbi:hypothetical protein FRC17_008045 [Serendipita sp. 399]|nr:hypothetical protein FRC17_008045 [Serendipita sp. 399]
MNLSALRSQLEIAESLEDIQFFSASEGLLTDLGHHEDQITELAELLCSKLENYNTLRASLDDSISTLTANVDEKHPSSSRPSPISHCPYEILAFIFENIVEEGSHAIQPLLLVNKQFYQVAISDPFLWRKITIKINKYMGEANSLSTSYINACLHRSEDVLLDVELDCSAASTQTEYIKRVMFDAIQQSMDEEDPKCVVNGISHALDRTGGFKYPVYEQKWRRFMDIVHSLTGPAWIHMRRWRSAFISLPNIKILAGDVWGLLSAGHAPNLQDLQIINFELDNTFPLPPHANAVHANFRRAEFISDDLFPAWPAIQRLLITGKTDLSQIPIAFASLDSLEFECYTISAWNVDTLAQCIFLRELTINCALTYRHHIRRAHVHLPHLASLTLRGNINLLKHTQFHLPSIERWFLQCNSSQGPLEIRAPYVEWYISSSQLLEEELWFLAGLIEKFTMPVSLTVKNMRNPETGYDMIRQMQEEGRLNRYLTVIVIEDKPEDDDDSKTERGEDENDVNDDLFFGSPSP